MGRMKEMMMAMPSPNDYVWDDTEYHRDDLIVSADRWEDEQRWSKAIDQIERRELQRALKQLKDFQRLQIRAGANKTPAAVRRAIEKAITECEQQVLALGGSIPEVVF